MMRLQFAMLAAAMAHPSAAQVLDFHRQRATAAERLKEDARQRDAEALAAAFTLCDGRYFPDRGALLVFLTDHEKTLQGRTLTQTETHRVRRIADLVWATGAESGMAVVGNIDPAPQMAVCAWCHRDYEQARGFGVFCSRSCCIDEGNAPGGLEIATRPA